MEIPLAITNSNNLCFLSYSVPVLLRLSILLIFPTNLFGLNFHTWPLCSSWFLLLFFWLGFINFINLSENQFLVFLISLQFLFHFTDLHSFFYMSSSLCQKEIFSFSFKILPHRATHFSLCPTCVDKLNFNYIPVSIFSSFSPSIVVPELLRNMLFNF